jgi:peptidyl-prolyl cis-trans isomerase D
MLQIIRDKISGWFAIAFLGSIAVVFIFWGVEPPSLGTANYAAKVNGESIPIESVRRAWQDRYTRIQQAMPNVPPELLTAQQQMVLDEFVQTRLLQQRARELGYHVSDAVLAQTIRSEPQLQIDGKFSQQAYDALLRQQGGSVTQFEEDLRQRLSVSQLQRGVVDSAFITPFELKRRAALTAEERELDYLLIPASKFSDAVVVDDAAVQAWFKEHQGEYMVPESVDLEYVEVTRAMAESKVEATEAALQEYYEQIKAQRFETPERRHPRHILLSVPADASPAVDAAKRKQAEELLAKAKSGADFAALAKQYSDDKGSAINGGDLDWVERGTDNFAKSFAEALYSMSAGEIRGPVKTQFGYHIIRLDEVQPAKTRSFADVRAEVEADFRKTKSQGIFYAQTQELDEKAFNSLTELKSVAQALNAPLKTAKGFTRQGGGDLGSDKALADAAFSEDVLERGQNSPLITLGEDQALVLRVTERRPAKPKPLEEVRAEIEAKLKRQMAQRAVEKQGADLLARLKKGEDWGAIAAEAQITPAGKRFVKRDDKIIPAAARKAAFDVPRTAISEAKPYYVGAATEDGNYVVLAVSAVRSGEVPPDQGPAEKARELQAAQQFGSEEFAIYVQGAEKSAKIVRNPTVFE